MSKSALIALVGISVLVAAAAGALIAGADGIQVVESVCSLVGIPVGIYLTLTIREIRNRYFRHAMLKSFCFRLKQLAHILSETVQPPDPDRARQLVAQVRPVLLQVEKHFPHPTGEKWAFVELEKLTDAERRSVIPRLRDSILPGVLERVTAIELEIERIEAGGDHER